MLVHFCRVLLSRINIRKIQVCPREAQAVFESCRIRMAGWSHRRVVWTNALAVRCTYEHLGAPTTILGAPESGSDIAWEYHESQQSILVTIFSFGTLLGCKEIIATTYHSTMFKTLVISLYTPLHTYTSRNLYSYQSPYNISGPAAGSA